MTTTERSISDDRLEDLKERARDDGQRHGRSAVRHCEIEHNDRLEDWKQTEDDDTLRRILWNEAFHAEQNSRQYASHPINFLPKDAPGWALDEIERAFTAGVSEGIEDGMPERVEREQGRLEDW